MTNIYLIYFILNNYTQRVINYLNLESIEEENWVKNYSSKFNNEKWLSYYVNNSQQGGGTEILIRLPKPSTEDLLNIVINSQCENEVETGCLILLNNEEISKTEFRSRLIQELEKNGDQKRQKTIIDITNLTSTINRREIIGKSLNQINEDENYFKNISERAIKIETANNRGSR
ncbi:MAG: hypothetical protein H7239_08635 [Flavobacterium sp.]|nr:hypothetical protein [Flavobacterium sp.]